MRHNAARFIKKKSVITGNFYQYTDIWNMTIALMLIHLFVSKSLSLQSTSQYFRSLFEDEKIYVLFCVSLAINLQL